MHLKIMHNVIEKLLKQTSSYQLATYIGKIFEVENFQDYLSMIHYANYISKIYWTIIAWLYTIISRN